MDTYSNVQLSDNVIDSYSNGSEKRVLYFSDGTLEVDEIDGDPAVELDSKTVPINPQELSWAPWMWYQTLSAGSKALEVCDYLGESLASFFGITTPKYQFELNEHYRMKKEEEEEEARNNIEMGSWTKDMDDVSNEAISSAPKTFVRNEMSNNA